MATEKDQSSGAQMCKHPACKCRAEDGDCCGEFCKSSDTTGEDPHCGCGHMACDMTAEMGNESTFASSGS